MASDFPIYNIFIPHKVHLSKVYDDTIECDLKKKIDYCSAAPVWPEGGWRIRLA